MSPLTEPMNRQYILKALQMILAAVLLAACSADDATNTPADKDKTSEIRLNAEVWRMMEGTRATTYDNQAAIQAEGSFTCYAYDAGKTTVNTTSNVSGISVNWNDGASKWEFEDGTHKWPSSGFLDFFAYMPAAATISTDAPYIKSLSYSTGHNVSFTCTSLPMTAATQGSTLKEFIYAMALDQDKDGTNAEAQPTAGEVALTFKHPFARIYLRWSSVDHSSITLNWVKIKSIKNNGNFLFNGTTSTWTPNGEYTDFESTVLDANDAAFPVPYIMIPQEWTGAIDVNVTWDDWGTPKTETLSTTVPTVTWQPGYSYTYTFTINKSALKVDVSKFTEQW